MKKLLIVVVTLLGSYVSDGQNQVRQGSAAPVSQDARIETDRLDRLVGLRKDQRERILSLNNDIEVKLEAMRASGQDSPEAIRNLNQMRVDVYMSLLTEVQIAKYKATSGGR